MLFLFFFEVFWFEVVSIVYDFLWFVGFVGVADVDLALVDGFVVFLWFGFYC